MKKSYTILLALIVSCTAATHADNAVDQRPSGEHRGPFRGGPGGPGGPRHRPPPPPVIIALDVNKDGTLDAQEIANAALALGSLDKNGDGKLSDEEMRPPRPAHFPGGPEGQPGEGERRRPEGDREGFRDQRGPRGDFQREGDSDRFGGGVRGEKRGDRDNDSRPRRPASE